MATRDMELKCKVNGHTYVLGVDEAGCGPLAGPMTVACVLLPDQFELKYLKDSKKYSEKARRKVFDQLMETDMIYDVQIISAQTIDVMNVYQARLKGMRDAVNNVIREIEDTYNVNINTSDKKVHVLVDGNAKPVMDVSMSCVIKGDNKCTNIAAASIIAKVTRDRIMSGLHEIYPDWNFNKHKGYGTKQHRFKIIDERLITPEHRKSFQPVKNIIETDNYTIDHGVNPNVCLYCNGPIEEDEPMYKDYHKRCKDQLK